MHYPIIALIRGSERPKGRGLELGAQRAPRLLVLLYICTFWYVHSKICERFRGFGCAIRRSPHFPFLSENWFWFNKRFAWHLGRPFNAVLEKQGSYIQDNWSSEIYQNFVKEKISHSFLMRIFETKKLCEINHQWDSNHNIDFDSHWQLALIPYKGLGII